VATAADAFFSYEPYDQPGTQAASLRNTITYYAIARCVQLFRRGRDGLFLISRQGYSVVLCCPKLFPIKTINCQPSSDGNLQVGYSSVPGLFKHGIQAFPPFLLLSLA